MLPSVRKKLLRSCILKPVSGFFVVSLYLKMKEKPLDFQSRLLVNNEPQSFEEGISRWEIKILLFILLENTARRNGPNRSNYRITIYAYLYPIAVYTVFPH